MQPSEKEIHSKTKVRDIKAKARNIKAKHQSEVRKDCYMKGSLLKDVYVYSCRDVADNKSTKLSLLTFVIKNVTCFSLGSHKS